MENFSLIPLTAKRRAINSIIFFFLISVLAGLSGCRKDFAFDKVKDLQWNPYIALPLVNDSITLRKAIITSGAQNHVYIDESGNISFLYYFNNDAFRLRPSDLIKLAPLNFSYLRQITAAEQAILQNADLPIPPVPFNINLEGLIAGARVDKLVIKQGSVRVNTNHTFSNAGSLTVKILHATKNGLPFSFVLGPMVSGPAQSVIDLSGVTLDLTTTPNMVQAEVEGLLKKSPSPVAGDEIRADFQLIIDTIGWFQGFLGKQTFPQLSDTVRVNVFNNAFALGEVYFEDPQAIVTIINSIGIPAEITIEKLVAINNASGLTLDIANRLGAEAVFTVPSPSITATQPIIKRVFYNNDNTGSAMNDFFNMKPDNVAFQIKTVINPEGTPVNFFADTSSFYDTLRVKLPLWGHFDHLTFQDTFDLVIEKPEEIEYLEFRTKISNGLPLTAMLQVYFTDDKYVKKDSLAGNDQIFIVEAPVDPSTALPYPGMFGLRDTTFILTSDRMKNLQNVKKALVKAVLNSADGGHTSVKLKADQHLKLNFTAKAKLKKNIEFGK